MSHEQHHLQERGTDETTIRGQQTWPKDSRNQAVISRVNFLMNCSALSSKGTSNPL